MNKPSQNFIVIGQISFKQVWDGILKVDQSWNCLNAVSFGFFGIVNFNLKKFKSIGQFIFNR